MSREWMFLEFMECYVEDSWKYIYIYIKGKLFVLVIGIY